MIDDTYLDPMEERFVPLALSVGRAVLGAAALEKVLLVDIINRKTARQGLRAELTHELSHLEKQPAGRLLQVLRELKVGPDLAQRIDAAIRRRNQLVHHYMEEPDVAAALVTGRGIDKLVERLDALAIEFQQLINAIAPEAFNGLQRALGLDIQQLIQLIRSIDLDEVEDASLREQLMLLGKIDLDQLEKLLTEAASG